MGSVVFNIDPQLGQTSYPVISLAICDLRLVDDTRWPWTLLIPRIPHMVEMIDISPELRSQVWLEIDHISRVMRDQFSPSKLNVAWLGNQVRQLHIHIIARYQDDEAWPNPVWGVGNAKPYDTAELNARLSILRTSLK